MNTRLAFFLNTTENSGFLYTTNCLEKFVFKNKTNVSIKVLAKPMTV